MNSSESQTLGATRDLVIGTATSQRFRPILEFLVVALVVVFVSGIAATEFSRMATQIVTTEAMSLTAGLKSEMLAYRSDRGQWPESNDDVSLSETSGRYIERLDVIPGGGISVSYRDKLRDGRAFALGSKELTFRAATVKDMPGSQVVWLCARQPVPPGMVVTTDNLTTVPLSLLPPICTGSE